VDSISPVYRIPLWPKNRASHDLLMRQDGRGQFKSALFFASFCKASTGKPPAQDCFATVEPINTQEETMRKFTTIAVGLALALALSVGNAMADSITYSIDNPNPALAGFTGPYGTVDVSLTSSTAATITFTSLTTNGVTFLMGTSSAVGVNVAGTYSVGTITPTFLSSAFNGTFSNGGAGNMDGFGFFNLTISDSCGYPCSASKVEFALNATGSTIWANAASVLTPNSQGAFVVMHGVACNPCTVEAGALATGFAANGGAVNSAPEPTSISLLGAGLLGISIWKRRKIACA
jgi:hypothetical protein